MSARVSLLAISFAIVLLPWLLWRLRAVRRVAPLAVVQILVGVALGPSGLGRLAPDLHAALFTRPVLAALDGVASLGVLLYVLVTGLHLDVALLRRDGRRLGGVALGSVAAPLLLGGLAGWWMLHAMPGAVGPAGGGPTFVASVAICIAVTALPVLAAVLQELGLLATRLGQTALALAALNDAALWVMLALLLTVAGSHGAGGLAGLAAAGLWLGLLLLAGRPLLGRLRDVGERARLVIGVSLAIASAGVSEALGTGYLIGAFAAGIAIPAAWRTALLGRLELVTATVLLPFFFMATGLRALIEPGSASFLALLAIAVAATVAGKLAGTALPARRLGFTLAESLSLGAMMQTKGLMEVVVLAVLHDAGLIGGQIFSAMVAMAVVCTVITAPAVRLCRHLEAGRPARPPDGERIAAEGRRAD
ncbi:cation:proton antiporter [Roseomonas sp. NAR14]|uniref:Cation:proton antiporter n=1 Tax=Roseomonas acroporae TaxID=2937791 RepID=A0A9X1Y8V4_9PROT|nr:cation:proton antiporter [Roseomonas acroporae]MCK8784247.1 cation:proton antiporter [Roseomonas acroporae]